MTARRRLLALRASPWIQRRRGRLALVGVTMALTALALVATVQAVTIAASASVSPSFMYLGDSDTAFTATVTNTGTVGLGAVEIERPANSWSVAACPAGPAGWSIQQDSTKCRYRSAPGTADDIAPGATSSAFRLAVASSLGNRDRTGSWKVRVSQTDSFSNPNTVVAASAAPPGLDNTAHAWQILDAVVASDPSTPGSACPASNQEALTQSTQTVVICGRNRSSQAHTPTAALSTLAGTFIADPGTFGSASIPAQSATSVVLGNWTGATVSGSSGSATVVVRIRSAANETSPLTTLEGYQAINRPPAANGDTATTDEDTVAPISVLANDVDPESHVLAVTAVNTTGTVGSVTIATGGTSVSYDPDGQFDGLGPGGTANDTFVYTVSDGHGGTDTATVTVTITGLNDPPDAVADGGPGFATDEDTAVTTASVLANDSDVEGGVITVTGFDDSATSGSVTDNGDGTFDYDPAGAFEGLGAGDTTTDTFGYTISDVHGGIATATVTITITGLNDGPAAAADSYAGVVGNTKAALGTTSSGPVVVLTGTVLLANDTDPDDAGSTLSASLVSASPGATVTVNADGSFVYVPPAGLSGTTDAFTYRVSDSAGAFDDATVEVAIGTDIVWYVNSAAGGSGDGRSTTPFTTLASLRGAGDADAAGETIFVYGGSGPYAGGIPLEADQALIGQPAGLTVASHVLVPAGGSRPVISNTGGDGIGLASGTSVRSVTVANPSRDGIAGVNVTGVTVSDVVVSGSGRDGVHLLGSGAGSIGLTLSGSAVTDSTGAGLLVRGSGSTTADVGTTGSTFDGNGIGVNVVASASDEMTFEVSDNDFTDQTGNAVQVLTAAPPAGQADAEVIRGQIRDNVIGGTAAGSGSADLIGIAIEINGDADAVIAITGNAISHTDQDGIFVQARLDNDGDGDHGRLDLSLLDNVVGAPDDDSAFPFGLVHGIRVESRNTTDVCLDIAGNDSSSIGGGSDVRLRQRDGSTFRLERFVGSGTSDGDVAAFVIAQNASGSTASATHATSYTGVADGTCRTP